MSLSRSSISKSVRLQKKLRFQAKGKETWRTYEIGEYLAITIKGNIPIKKKTIKGNTSLAKNDSFPCCLQ